MTHYFWTLRHLTVAQLWHRSRRTIRRRWWRALSRTVPDPGPQQLVPHDPLYKGLRDIPEATTVKEEISAAIERARAVSEQRFCFLSQSVTFGDRLSWNEPALSQLWRYHLHYFDYVQDLLVWAASGEIDLAYRTFRRVALSWIEDNRALAGDGWHPYTLSLRIVNWLHGCSYFSAQLKADGQTEDLLLRSLYAQTRILFTDLELDVRGNHLLENLRALIWGGLAFHGDEPRQWLRHGLRLLEVEVAEQVLSDGGHFERSPGYHLVVFKDLLSIALWLRRNQGEVPSWLEAALDRMCQYLWGILPPDGNVPLLKDTAWDAALQPQDLLAASAIYFNEPLYKYEESFGLYPLLLFGLAALKLFKTWAVNQAERESVALRASGHYVMRDEQSGEHLILDAGKTCPDYLPAHAQADSLTFEMSFEGRRVVVDSGIYEYTAGPWRDYFRSTRAHNTVEVAGKNQSEIWSSFRVGRRAQPGPVVWQCEADYVLAQAEHDGYCRLPVSVVHQRTVVWRPRRFWLVVDQLWGRGHTSLANHLHLHPDLSFAALDASSWRILPSPPSLCLTAFGAQSNTITNGQIEPFRQGWYSERFGEQRSNRVLTLYQKGALPLCTGYVITQEGPAEIETTAICAGHHISLTLGERRHGLRLVRNETPRFT